MAKVAFKAAKDEVIKFIDSTGIDLDFEMDEITSIKVEKTDDKIEKLSAVKKIIKNVMNGSFTIDENSNISVVLKYPPTKSGLKTLDFNNRVSVKDQNDRLKQFDTEDGHGSVVAVTAARTGLGTGMIQTLDLIDYNKAALITGLFL